MRLIFFILGGIGSILFTNNGISGLLEAKKYISAQEAVSDDFISIPCHHHSFNALKNDTVYTQECLAELCGRRIIDGLFDPSDIQKLLAIAEKGMSNRDDPGGPTILDINTGYIRDQNGLDNLFMKSNDIYTVDDFSHYGHIIQQLKQKVMETFHINTLYFTAPTFITKINAGIEWAPISVHDEYWHPHVDMNNTEHYQYSGLLYLNTYGEDFTGGRLHFVNPEEHDQFDTAFQQDLTSILQRNPSLVEVTVEPKAGRLAIFSSGMENTHFVEQVRTGKRFVLSFWFTCNAQREFQIFLDGQAHITFSKKFKETLLKKNTKTKANYAKKSATKTSSEL